MACRLAVMVRGRIVVERRVAMERDVFGRGLRLSIRLVRSRRVFTGHARHLGGSCCKRSATADAWRRADTVRAPARRSARDGCARKGGRGFALPWRP
jgi:hypothetical protein